MTISDKQGKTLFGKSAVWEIMFIARPIDALSALGAWLDHPDECAAASFVIKALRREQKAKPTRPTRCLLCDRDFLRRMPAGLVIMSPATRKGPSAGFALCDDCIAKPDLEERAHAYLHAKFGAQRTQWGTA
jgi:hypothetical protein